MMLAVYGFLEQTLSLAVAWLRSFCGGAFELTTQAARTNPATARATPARFTH